MVIEKHSKSSKQNRRRCFFEVAIDGEPAGRIIMELFDELVPKTTENFLMLCTGQAGVGKTTGKPLHYKGSLFHRVIKSFMIQGGDFSAGNGTGGESIYGGIFEDEAFPAKHDQSFLLSMANRGPDTNGSQFFITTQPAPHLDGKHVVFGKVISGEDVVTKIENLKVNNKNRPIQDVMIINCGQLVRKKDLQTDDEKNLDSNELSDESETDKKRRKKEKKRRRKHSEDTDYVEGDKGAEPPGPESMSSVKPEDLPEVPETNKFLLRRSKTPEGAMSGRQRRETSGKDASYRTSQSGHRIRGRGSIRYHTPSPEGYRARSRSITPPHWKREEKRLITLRELERMKKEREEHDAEMKRERDRHQNEDESMDTFGFRQPAFPVNSIIPPASYATIGKIGRAVDERRRSRSSEHGRNRERDRERSRERSRRDRTRSRSHERRRDRSRSRSNRRRYRSRSRSRSRSRNRDRDRDHDRLLERREFERARRLSRDRRISPLRSSGKSPMRGERAEDFLRDREREPERSSRSRYRYERNAERRSPLLESSPPTRSLRRLQYRDEGEVSDTDDKQFHDHVRKRSRSPPRRQSRSPIRNGGFSPPVSPLLDPPKRRKFTEAKQVKNELELSALSDRADDEADNIGILTKKQLLKKKTEEMEEAVLHYTQLDEGPISAIDIDMSALLELAANDNKDSNERLEKQSPEIEKEVTAVHKIASEKHTLVLDEPEEIQPPQFRSFTKKLKQSKSEIPTTKKLVSPTVVEERQEIGMEMEEEDENITLKPTIKYPVESNGEVNEPQQKISEIATKSLDKEQTKEVHPTEHKVHKTRSHKEELIVPDQKKAQTSEVVTTAHEEPSKSESVERAEIRMKLAGSPATKHSVVNQKKPKAFEQSASSESEGEESEKQLEKRSRKSRSSSGSSSASSRSSREKSKSSSPDGKSSGSESVASSKSGRRSSSSSSAAAASKKSSSATSSPSRASSKSSAVSKKSASPTTASATAAVEETRRESSVKSESSSASSKSGVSKKSRDSSSSSSSSSASGSSAKKSAASSSSAASSASSRSSSPRRSRSRSRSRRRRSRSRSSDRYRRSSRRRSRSRSRRRRSRSRSSRYRSRRSRSDSRNRRRRSRSRSRSWRRRSRSRSRSSRRRR